MNLILLRFFPISSLSVEKTLDELDDPLYSEYRSWLLKRASWPGDTVPHRFLGCLLSSAVGRKSTRPDRVEILDYIGYPTGYRIALCQWSIKWSLKWRNGKHTHKKTPLARTTWPCIFWRTTAVMWLVSFIDCIMCFYILTRSEILLLTECLLSTVTVRVLGRGQTKPWIAFIICIICSQEEAFLLQMV